MKPFLGLTNYTEPYGVEIEIEGRNLSTPNIKGKPWNFVSDGSLRGESVECNLKNPMSLGNAYSAIDGLYDGFQHTSSVLYETGRAGVHIHINVRDWTWDDLRNFILKYFAVEKALINFCGKEREGNFFCVSADYGSALIPTICEYIFKGNDRSRTLRVFDLSHFKYSSLNIASIMQHGSLEIRCMRSSSSAAPIKEFLKIIDTLVNNPINILSLGENNLWEAVVKLHEDLGFDKEGEMVLQGFKNCVEILAGLASNPYLNQIIQEQRIRLSPTPLASQARRVNAINWVGDF